MDWIYLSLIYALTNALYLTFNAKHNYNGYVLGIWRGFGISLLVSPLLLTVPLNLSPEYILILVLQGLMIGIYDSHLFFATGRYGSHASSGFMATTVWITALLWWTIDFPELQNLMKTPKKLITIVLILCGFSVSYWQMMNVHVNKIAEKYLYPAVFALALMSIATRYIALNGGSAYAGVIYYLTIACFTSGLYNTILFFITTPSSDTPKRTLLFAPINKGNAIWLDSHHRQNPSPKRNHQPSIRCGNAPHLSDACRNHKNPYPKTDPLLSFSSRLSCLIASRRTLDPMPVA